MSIKIKDAVEKLALRLGYTVIPTWQEDSYPNAKYLARLFDLLQIDCVIDVGANLGQYRGFLREQVQYKGLIASFEPVPHHVQALKQQSAADENWEVDGCALGAEKGILEFNVMANTEFSSFLTPNHDDVSRFRGLNDVQQRVNVEVKTLDEVIPALQQGAKSKNIYLKLDTQGFDIEVLKGASKTLSKVRALQTEASVRKLYEGMPRYDEVIRFCEERNFVMSGIFPNNAGHFPLLVEFDCYMISRDCVPSS